MKLKYTKTQLSIYLVWVLLHFFFWVAGGDFAFPEENWNEAFFPFELDGNVYDVREFLVYTIAPPVIFFAYQLAQPDKAEKNQ